MPVQRFLIAPLQTGLQKNLSPWLINDDAFSLLKNAYIFRGRVRKRYGAILTGINATSGKEQLHSRMRIALSGGSGVGTTDGSGNATGTVPGSVFKVGQMFSIGDEIFTVSETGTPGTMLTTGSATTHTYDTTNGAYVFAGATASTQIYFYPSEPITGIIQYESADIFDDKTFVFDTQFVYEYDGSSWDKSGPSSGNFHGGDSSFFTGANWQGTSSNTINLFVSNFYVVNRSGSTSANDDSMWYYNGSTWATFVPKFLVSGAGNTVANARLIKVFKDRLLLLNTIETDAAGTTHSQFVNRCRFSQNGSPFPVNTAWLEPNEVGATGGGWIDAPTKEGIVSAEFIRDRLIVYFEKSTWELVYTANHIQPFIWQKINTELGCQSTLSTVSFDKASLTVGRSSIHACNGVNVERFDEKIPDKVFDIRISNNGRERVVGIRDFFTELVYWTFPDASDSSNLNIYPNRVLVYNYSNRSWALNDDSITCFGYFDQQNLVVWTARTSGFATSDIFDVKFGNSIWVIVGANGKLATASDPTSTWTARTSSFGTDEIMHIDYDGSTNWVIVGDNGKLATATDPTATWTQRTSSFSATYIYSVAYGDSKWVAVGEEGQLATASDPTSTWTQRENPFDDDAVIYDVAYGNGKWVAVGEGVKIITASDPTGDWDVVGSSGDVEIDFEEVDSTFGTSTITAVHYSDGYWVAVGENGKIATATDPDTWTQQTSPLDSTWNLKSLYKGPTYWVAHKHRSESTGGIIYATNPTSTWTPKDILGMNEGRVVFQDGNYWVAGVNRQHQIWTATDPTGTWTYNPGQPPSPWGSDDETRSYASDGTNWLVVGGYDAAKIATTTNPTSTWTNIDHGITCSQFKGVEYADGIWVVVGNEGVVATATSPSGPWTKRDSGLPSYIEPGVNTELFDVAYGDGVWMAVGGKGVVIITDDPTSTWETITPPLGDTTLSSVAYGNGKWVIAGANGKMAIGEGFLSDNIDWEEMESPISVKYSDNIWVATTNYGNILTATDPTEEWIKRESNFDDIANDVNYGDDTWLICGYEGKVSTAANAEGAWTFSKTPTTSDLNSSDYGNNVWVVVGDEGTLLTSANPAGKPGSDRRQDESHQILSGNQQGFVNIIKPTVTSCAPTLQITKVERHNIVYAKLTVVNHNLDVGDFVKVENCSGLTLFNDSIYKISSVIDVDTIILLGGGLFVGTYTGGGTLTRVPKLDILTKEFNPYISGGDGVFLNEANFLVNRTEDGEISVDTYVSSSSQSIYSAGRSTGAALGTSILSCKANEDNELEEYQDMLWRSLYFMSEGDFVQLRFFMNDDQMQDVKIVESDFQLHSMILSLQRVALRI